MAAAGVEVYHATEVNLVAASMVPVNPMPNNVLEVLPFVALDFVSYSSYDTMGQSPGLGLVRPLPPRCHGHCGCACLVTRRARRP